MVSVIIPAYNAEAFIGRALDSLLSQTYSNLEIVVVNDGSKDGTQRVVESYVERFSQIVLLNVENGGVSRARNIGMDHARGEYVVFLDADDEYLPDSIQKMRDCMDRCEADLCATRHCSSNRRDDVVVEAEPIVWSLQEALKNVLEDHPATYSCCAKMYRAKNLREQQIRFPEGMRAHEDSFFVFCCIVSGMKFVDYGVTTMVYTVQEGSASRSGFSEKMFDILKLADEKYRIIREQYPELADKAINVQIKAHMAFLHTVCQSRDKKYREAEKKSLAFVRKNKRYFVSAIPGDKRWFTIIRYRLYGLYKLRFK